VAIEITVCVGSSCHVRHSRDMLRRFAEIIKTEHLEDKLTLVGSFCMERCGEGMNWRFGGDDITSSSVEQAEQTLRKKIEEFS
jgi:NADH:ubiquinone oxidoreductase subunit E